MKRILYIILAGILLLAVSCVKEETPETYLQILQSDVNFTAAGGPGEILISTNASEVSASSDKSWLTVSTAGTESVQFTVEESGEAFSRIANVTISAGGQSQEVSISQMGLIFTVSSDEIASGFEIDPEGGSISFGFSTSGISDPTVTIPEADSWLESSIQDGQVILSAEINLSGSDRSTTVSVGSGWKTFEFPVSQSDLPILEQTELTFSMDVLDAKFVSVTEYVGSDVVWSVSTDDEWITAEKTADGQISVSVTENTTGEVRTGEVRMTDAEGNVMETITVTQRNYGYSSFAGNWVLSYMDVDSDGYFVAASATVSIVENNDRSGYYMYIPDPSLGTSRVALSYDDTESMLSWTKQYMMSGSFQGGITGYFWWMPYVNSADYSFDMPDNAGMDLLYDPAGDTISFENNGVLSDVIGFWLYIFTSETPSDDQDDQLGYWSFIVNMDPMTRAE